MNVKMRAPNHISGFSYQGTAVDLDENGEVEVSCNPSMVAAMKDHGFEEVEQEQTKKAPLALAKTAKK